MAMYRTEDFKTPICRVSFAWNLFKTRDVSDTDTPRMKYGATLIFPKAALTEKVPQPGGKAISLEELVAECIKGQWNERGLERAAKGLIKSPFIDGAGKQAYSKKTGELNPGMGPDVFFIRVQANEDRPPKVSSSATAFVPCTEKDVYSGCYGYAIINAYAWNNEKQGDGVSLGIQCFFKKLEGERLVASSDGGDPDKWAESIPDTGAAPAATKSGAGAGGLFGSVME